MPVKTVVLAVGIWASAAGLVAAQQAVSKGDVIKATATISQIDHTARLITFKDSSGAEDTVWAGPEVKRFDELKVGDKVTMTYYESHVFRIRKPGDPPLAAGGAAVTPGGQALPGGTVAKQTVQTVVVKTVDPSAGTITVTTSGGRTISRKVDDKKNLTGVKVGDTIDIVSTEAVVATVERSN